MREPLLARLFAPPTRLVLGGFGRVGVVHLESGEIVTTLETEFKAPKRCLAGIAEYSGKA